MMRANEYLRVRRYIKTLCLDSAVEMCERVGLDELDAELVIQTNKNYTRVHTALDLGMCESAVSKRKNKVFAKIRDYLKKNNIEY